MKRNVVGIAALAIALLAVAMPANAKERPVDEDQLRVESYAIDYGLTMGEAKERLSELDRLDDVLTRIVEDEGDRIIASRLVHTGEKMAEVRLSGDAPLGLVFTETVRGAFSRPHIVDLVLKRIRLDQLPRSPLTAMSERAT